MLVFGIEVIITYLCKINYCDFRNLTLSGPSPEDGEGGGGGGEAESARADFNFRKLPCN